MLFSEETKAAIESLLFITNEPLALEQLAQLTDIELDEADMETIAGLDKGERYITGKKFVFGDYTAEDIFA